VILDIDTTTAPATISLLEPDDFKAFSVRRRGPNGDRLLPAVERIGRAAGDDHVYVDVDALKAIAGDRGHDPGWLSSLEGMLSYARSEGWVAEDGFVRAHVERPD
jgi:hypothetical protein